MKFNAGFFNALLIIIRILRTILDAFGDDDEKAAANKFVDNDLKHL